MKLLHSFKIMELVDERVAIPSGDSTDFRGAIRVNETTADIMKLLEKDTTVEDMVAALQQEYDATPEQLRESVELVVNTLRAEGLLAE